MTTQPGWWDSFSVQHFTGSNTEEQINHRIQYAQTYIQQYTMYTDSIHHTAQKNSGFPFKVFASVSSKNSEWVSGGCGLVRCEQGVRVVAFTWSQWWVWEFWMCWVRGYCLCDCIVYLIGVFYFIIVCNESCDGCVISWQKCAGMWVDLCKVRTAMVKGRSLVELLCWGASGEVWCCSLSQRKLQIQWHMRG